jgi:N-acetylneuraminic acid mutarotase
MKPLPITVMTFGMTTLNNMPYTFGGADGDFRTVYEKRQKFDNVYMFSFDTNEWLGRARMPVSTAEQAVAALDDDTVLMCGGYNQLTALCTACASYTRHLRMYGRGTNGQ